MDVAEAIKTRKSIRRFKSDPVPKETLMEILKISSRAPSAVNFQPWEYTVVAGEVLEKIKVENVEMIKSGGKPGIERFSDGMPVEAHFDRESSYRKRQVDLAMRLFKLMDIPREDKVKRAEWLERGFRFFDAPAAIIITVQSSFNLEGPLVDIGALMQNICLLALNYGLGTCIEDQGIMFPDVLRKHLDIPQSKRILLCIAIGYPDWDFPANRIETDREPIENISTWYGF